MRFAPVKRFWALEMAKNIQQVLEKSGWSAAHFFTKFKTIFAFFSEKMFLCPNSRNIEKWYSQLEISWLWMVYVPNQPTELDLISKKTVFCRLIWDASHQVLPIVLKGSAPELLPRNNWMSPCEKFGFLKWMFGHYSGVFYQRYNFI